MIDFFTTLGGYIMAPLYYAISAILLGWHSLWSQVFPPDSGASWVLSIIGLTLVVRAALIPLFVKQIKSSRNMQMIQPKVKELQKKYGHDRERLTQETMALYKESGTNPFASCLPILLQMPIFIALFRLLERAAEEQPRGLMDLESARQFSEAELFGVSISATFLGAGGDVGVIVMALVLVLAMTATTFLTQRQLMSKNMPPDALSGPYAQQQKLLLYVLPLVFAVGGIAFPIALLLYWTTSNLWTMAQQFYVIRNNPAPGTAAEKAKIARDRAKEARRRGMTVEEMDLAELKEREAEEAAKPAPETKKRQQPKRKSREERRKQSGGSSPSSPSSSSGSTGDATDGA